MNYHPRTTDLGFGHASKLKLGRPSELSSTGPTFGLHVRSIFISATSEGHDSPANGPGRGHWSANLGPGRHRPPGESRDLERP